MNHVNAIRNEVFDGMQDELLLGLIDDRAKRADNLVAEDYRISLL